MDTHQLTIATRMEMALANSGEQCSGPDNNTHNACAWTPMDNRSKRDKQLMLSVCGFVFIVVR